VEFLGLGEWAPPFFKSKTLPTREEISRLAADEFMKEYAKYREEAIRRGK